MAFDSVELIRHAGRERPVHNKNCLASTMPLVKTAHSSATVTEIPVRRSAGAVGVAIVLGSSVSLGLVGVAMAQIVDESDADSIAADGYLPTIVVTPAWRPVDVQEVPASVNHYDGESLTGTGIYNTLDLQYRTPGLVFKTNAVLGQPYLRGIGSDFVSAGAESSVATFIDGVYMPRAYDTIVDFFDVDRVEVIRGPQAVHLGRNVVGGAVSIHNVDPQPRAGGYLDVSLGNYAQRQVRGALNAPLLKGADGGEIALRLAGISTQRDGYVSNVLLGSDANDDSFHAMRAKLLVAPAGRTELLLGVERHSEDSSRSLGSHPHPEAGTNGGILMGGTVPDNPRQVTENIPPEIRMTSMRYNARVMWEGDSFDLSSTTAWIATDAELALDLDGTDADFSANFPSGRSRSLMQELRIVADRGDSLSWTAGTFVLSEEAAQMLDVRLPQVATRNVALGNVDTASHAVFGEVGYRFSDRVRGTAGMRYSRDRRRHDFTRTVTTEGGQTIATQNAAARFSALTPELGVEFSPGTDRLYYFNAARGYKAGGFNTSTIQPAFEPEFIVAYEAGMKATLPGHGLRLNGAVYHYDYRDMQLNTPPTDAPPGTFPRVINAARSTIRGLDLHVLYQPLQSPWFIDAVGALMQARFSNFRSLDPNNPDVDPDRAGNALPQAPDVSINLGIGRRWTTAPGMLSARIDYRYQSGIHFNIYEDPALYQPGYGLLGAVVAFAPAGGGWFAEAWGRNLTNRLHAQTISRNDPLTGVKRFWGAPRTFGLRAGYRW